MGFESKSDREVHDSLILVWLDEVVNEIGIK